MSTAKEIAIGAAGEVIGGIVAAVLVLFFFSKTTQPKPEEPESSQLTRRY